MGIDAGFAWQSGNDATLAELFFRHVDPSDFADRDDAAMLGCVRNLLGNVSVRLPGEALVVASNPTVAGNGWTCGRTVITIAADDMVFLVDSVASELSRMDIGIQVLVHPVVVATRDASGRLLEVSAPVEPDPDSPIEAPARSRVVSPVAPPALESWMHIEVDLQRDHQMLARIEAELARIMADVAKAVHDWPAMLEAARKIAAELHASPPPGVDRSEVDQTVELLRWLAEDHFTFLGYRPYRVQVRGAALRDIALVAPPNSGLGLLRSERVESTSFANLPEAVRAKAREPHPLILTKANRRSTVHRDVYLDYVGVKMFDAEGKVVGEHRFIGLFAASAYTQPVSKIPVIDRKVRALRVALDVSKGSHSSRNLQQFLETFPRDELFAADVAHLSTVARAALSMHERRATKLFVRVDPYQRFLSCLIYLPRDRYTTRVRLKIQALLREKVGAESVDHTARVTESMMARLHIVVRMAAGQPVPEVDAAALEAQIARIVRSWEDNLSAALSAHPDLGLALGNYPQGFPEAYKENVTAVAAVADLKALARLTPEEPLAVSLQQVDSASGAEANVGLKLYALSDISLARVLPVLTSMGVDVVTERPFMLVRVINSQTVQGWIYDFGLRSGPGADPGSHPRLWEDAFLACWRGLAETDGLNVLVASAGLSWRSVEILRAYARYLRQAGSAFSNRYIESVLVANSSVAALLVRLFESRFDPEGGPGRGVGSSAGRDWQNQAADLAAERLAAERLVAERLAAGAGISELISAELDVVASLDQDRILRSFRSLIMATLRTNFYRDQRRALAMKLDPSSIPGLPSPRPKFEIWVYSPRVEGVHLRYGPVARGGLRWSDRQEDFRTEILGLVKAQAVKNAVIVPVGAKGGFFAKHLPAMGSDREAWLAEGIAAYQIFIGSLLDLTDNLDLSAASGSAVVIPPPRVVRHDGDDAYLVVAADKGTATFSDIANAVAAQYGYWLGDAFASGGSAGYDHKSMGITARGAWESVRAHFRELGFDIGTQDFSCVGVGDMSGDVFGNGMLLSEHIQLVAAFDHRHVFLDPNPKAAESFAERRRLFELPRSSWADYNPALISAGGGVYARTSKSIPISAQVRARLGIEGSADSLTPVELLRAVLCAPVDLLWNAGIGTYVKAASESDAEVGDRTNDAIRIQGSQLRARVVGEGGNLGLTQRGRIEAARAGARINTDAIDNSAGVDTSDHEVNIKILLDRVVAAGALEAALRVPLLESMTQDVAHAVLRDNIEANILIGYKAHQGPAMVPALRRLLRELELHAELDRELEALPSDAELKTLQTSARGLSTPEISVIVAYTKLAMKEAVVNSGVPDEPWSLHWLHGYFPAALTQAYRPFLASHPLRRQIIANGLVNEMVNRGGITYQMRASEETGAGAAEIARAYAVTCAVFNLPDVWRRIETQEGAVASAGCHGLRSEVQRVLDRSTRWFLQMRGGTLDVGAEIQRFSATVRDLAGVVPGLLIGSERVRMDQRVAQFVELGVPVGLAQEVAALLDVFSLLDVVEVAVRCGEDAAQVAQLYFVLSERYEVDLLLERITDLPRGDRWSSLARAALRSDLYGALASLTARVIRATPEGGGAVDRVESWESRYAEGLGRAKATLREIGDLDVFDLATLSVALRTIRQLATQGG